MFGNFNKYLAYWNVIWKQKTSELIWFYADSSCFKNTRIIVDIYIFQCIFVMFKRKIQTYYYMLNVFRIYFVEYIKYRTSRFRFRQKWVTISWGLIINHSYCYNHRSHCKTLDALSKSSKIIQNWVLIPSINRSRNIQNISCERKNGKSPIKFLAQILSKIKYCNG